MLPSTSQDTAQVPSESDICPCLYQVVGRWPSVIENCEIKSTEKHQEKKASSHGPTAKLNITDILVHLIPRIFIKQKYIHGNVNGTLKMGWTLGVIFLCKYCIISVIDMLYLPEHPFRIEGQIFSYCWEAWLVDSA